jgi:hypothetical protein
MAYLLLMLTACGGGRSGEMAALLDRADSLNRAYVPMTDGIDSLLLEATKYYDRHGTANQQMRAHYLLGCAYRDMGEAPAALQSYQDAVDRADTLSSDCDYQRLMAVYGQMSELYDYVCEPERDDCSILEMDDEPPRSIPDSSIKEFLSARYGIDNMMELQNLEKNKRNLIIREVCEQGAGFRQLERITGISYGIIQRVVTDRRTSPDLLTNMTLI